MQPVTCNNADRPHCCGPCSDGYAIFPIIIRLFSVDKIINAANGTSVPCKRRRGACVLPVVLPGCAVPPPKLLQAVSWCTGAGWWLPYVVARPGSCFRVPTSYGRNIASSVIVYYVYSRSIVQFWMEFVILTRHVRSSSWSLLLVLKPMPTGNSTYYLSHAPVVPSPFSDYCSKWRQAPICSIGNIYHAGISYQFNLHAGWYPFSRSAISYVSRK